MGDAHEQVRREFSFQNAIPGGPWYTFDQDRAIAEIVRLRAEAENTRDVVAMFTPPLSPRVDINTPMPAQFLEYVERNYPPRTVISNPSWHAPKLWGAAVYALRALADAHAGGDRITHFVIPASAGLDPIRVFAVDHEPGKGTLVVQCYGDAWTCYFGAMNGRSLLEFIASVDRHYLGGALGRGNQRYNERVANAVILAARERVTTRTPDADAGAIRSEFPNAEASDA